MPRATTHGLYPTDWLGVFLLLLCCLPKVSAQSETITGPLLPIKREQLPYPSNYIPQLPRSLQPILSLPLNSSKDPTQLLQSDQVPNIVNNERPSIPSVMQPTVGVTESTPRSDHMTPSVQRFGYATILGAWLLAGDFAASRADAAEPTLTDVTKQLTELKTMLNRLNTDLEKKINDYQDSNAISINQLQKQITELKSKVSELQIDVADLKDQAKIAARTSESKRIDPSTPQQMPSGNSSTAAKASGQGKVRFVNDYVEELSVYVNGVGYRILPGSEVTVNVPAGNFTYQVLMLQSSVQTRAINSDELKNIRIHVAR